jgi:hypothetical protein
MSPGRVILSVCVMFCCAHDWQFRMHNSTAVDAYLDITSNPIIESCDQVRFGAFPGELKVQSFHYFLYLSV